MRVVGAPIDAVSQKVRAQYEEHPYPRWFSLERPASVSPAEWISGQLLGTGALSSIPDAPRVLVAGSGTGREAIGLAIGITGARVLALDLSLSSLAYAKRQAKELGVRNIEFAHGDILQLDALGEQFDIVHSVGVLHHMRDPDAGLGMLLRVSRPGALMKLGLYSSRARALALGPARQLIRQQNWATDESSIRAFRRLVLESPADSPLRGLLRIRDFFSVSECRDLLFHVQEHEFDLPQLARMLGARGITVVGLAKPLGHPAVLAYRKMVPQDSAMADLQRWDEVERLHPETFLAMYQVWCRVPGTD
jgi:SAM-dependent methyltransferase